MYLEFFCFFNRYFPHDTRQFSQFYSDALIRKAISEFYGTVTGIVVDEKVKPKEYEYIVNWRSDYKQYISIKAICEILAVLDKVVDDGIIIACEMELIKKTVKQYVDDIECSPVTLGTQVLAGILKGIACDNEITYSECSNLRVWLYEHNYLRGHFPFDKIIETLETVLQDGVITSEETTMMLNQLDELLNPVDSLKGSIANVKDKTVCLSGNFSYGQKSAVGLYITERLALLSSN